MMQQLSCAALLLPHLLLVAASLVHSLNPELITTDTPEPTAYIEASVSTETDSNAYSSRATPDPICNRCYDKIRLVKGLLDKHTEMVEKQELYKKQKPRRRKQKTKSPNDPKQQQQQPSNQLRSILSDRRSSPTEPAQTQAQPQAQAALASASAEAPATASSISSRTLNDAESKYTIVSRLRVHRSTDLLDSSGDATERSPPAVGASDTKEAIIARMTHEENVHLNATCRALYRAEECLDPLINICVSDLQYHSYSSVVGKWITKHKCQWRLTGKREWTNLGGAYRSEPEPVAAIARPISSDEMVRKRLHKLLGYDQAPEPSSASDSEENIEQEPRHQQQLNEQQHIISVRPSVGVMLRPTLTQSASRKFNTIQPSGLQFHQQSASTQARHHYQLTNEQGQFMPLASQLLLIPCFLILCIIVITITNYFYMK